MPYVWSDQFGAKLQYVGHAGPEDEVVEEEGRLGDERFVVSYRRNGLVTAALCVNEPRSVGSWTVRVAGDQGALPQPQSSVIVTAYSGQLSKTSRAASTRSAGTTPSPIADAIPSSSTSKRSGASTAQRLWPWHFC